MTQNKSTPTDAQQESLLRGFALIENSIIQSATNLQNGKPDAKLQLDPEYVQRIKKLNQNTADQQQQLVTLQKEVLFERATGEILSEYMLFNDIYQKVFSSIVAQQDHIPPQVVLNLMDQLYQINEQFGQQLALYEALPVAAFPKAKQHFVVQFQQLLQFYVKFTQQFESLIKSQKKTDLLKYQHLLQDKKTCDQQLKTLLLDFQNDASPNLKLL